LYSVMFVAGSNEICSNSGSSSSIVQLQLRAASM
jgi:hypothetical protein